MKKAPDSYFSKMTEYFMDFLDKPYVFIPVPLKAEILQDPIPLKSQIVSPLFDQYGSTIGAIFNENITGKKYEYNLIFHNHLINENANPWKLYIFHL